METNNKKTQVAELLVAIERELNQMVSVCERECEALSLVTGRAFTVAMPRNLAGVL